MNDDPEYPLLSELADLARQDAAEEARFDERWDRLAAGTLTAEEEAELLALAETSPEAREAWEAFRPLGPEFQARVVEKIAAELPKKGWWARLLPFPILPFRPAVRVGGWVTAAAAAAAVLVRVLWPSAPLPGYQIAVSGGSSEMRGELAEDFAPGDRLQVVLHPETAARTGRLEAQLFLLQGREQRRLDAWSEFDSGGAVRMKASLDRSLQPGTWTLWAVVGRPGNLPDPAELQALAARDEIRRRDWVAVPKSIRIRPRGP